MCNSVTHGSHRCQSLGRPGGRPSTAGGRPSSAWRAGGQCDALAGHVDLAAAGRAARRRARRAARRLPRRTGRRPDQARSTPPAESTVDLLRLRAGAVPDTPDAVARPASHDEVRRAAAGLRRPAGRGGAVRRRHLRRGRAPGRAAGVRGHRRDRPRARWTGCSPSTRSPGRPPSRPACGRPGPRRCSPSTASRSATSRSRSSTRRSAASPPPAPAARRQPATAASTTWSSALRVATPAGTLEAGRAPRSAAGPDLRQLVLGSEGAFGVVTSVTVQVRPTPSARAVRRLAVRLVHRRHRRGARLAQDGPLPTVLRLSDEMETAVGAATGGGAAAGGCLVLVGVEGTADTVTHRHAEVAGAAGRARRGGPGHRAGRERGCAAASRRRTCATPCWTPAPWSRRWRRRRSGATCRGCYAAVRDALLTDLADQGTPPLVMCHVSHVYPTGRVAVLHGGRRAGRRPGRAVAAGQGGRQRRDRRGGRARSATTTASAATTCPGTPRRSGRSAWPRCGRSRTPWTRRTSSTPACSSPDAARDRGVPVPVQCASSGRPQTCVDSGELPDPPTMTPAWDG